MVKSVGVIGTFAVCVGFLIARQDAFDAAKKKEATVRAVIVACKADKLGEQMLDQMGTLLKDSVGSAFWKKFRDKVRTQELVDMIVPIYARHFTQEELEQLLALYQSPIGKRMVEEQPLLVRESMEAGAEWGRKLAEEAMKECEEEEKKDGK
jgi:hypothetical protein